MATPAIPTTPVQETRPDKTYNFSVNEAIRWKSSDISAILHNIRFWLDQNKANNHNIKDGRVWTYNTLDAWTELFPWMSPSQIQRALKKLEDGGLLLKGNYNDSKFLKTVWYSLDEPWYIVPDIDDQFSKTSATTPETLDIAIPQSRHCESEISTLQNRNLSTYKKLHIKNKSISKAEPSADFDLIFLFVLTELKKTVCDFVQDDESLVRAKVEDYINWCLNRSVTPGKGAAFGFVNRGLGYEASANYNSAKIHQAKDNLTTAKTNRINATTDLINQSINVVSRDRNDRSWADGFDFD